MKVRLKITALTRVERSVVVEIPEGATQDALDDLYKQTYIREYNDDPSYWERGESTVEYVDVPITHEIINGKFRIIVPKEEVGVVLPVVFPPTVEPPFTVEDDLPRGNKPKDIEIGEEFRGGKKAFGQR